MPDISPSFTGGSSSAQARIDAAFSTNAAGMSVNYGNTVPWFVWLGLAVGGWMLWKRAR
jgi:hypothetical protein